MTSVFAPITSLIADLVAAILSAMGTITDGQATIVAFVVLVGTVYVVQRIMKWVGTIPGKIEAKL